MKFALASILAFASLAAAAPTPTAASGNTIAKRATITDACTVGFGAGTTGGSGGTTTTVSTLAQFTAAAQSKDKSVIVVKGNISGSTKVKIASNKSVIGAAGSSLTGIGLEVKRVENVILRNLKVSKVKASTGDAIGIDNANKVWVDHCDLSSDLTSGKDFYDGLLDITHAVMGVTVSNTFLHDHHKGSLVGHSDSNAAEDTGKLHVTYANNHWKNVGSRVPSVRFGTVHIFNNVEENISVSGVNTRMGAKVLVESSVFVNAKRPITSLDSKTKGTATVNDVDLGGAANDAPKGSFTNPGYSYSKVGSGKVKAAVVGTAGQTLKF